MLEVNEVEIGAADVDGATQSSQLVGTGTGVGLCKSFLASKTR